VVNPTQDAYFDRMWTDDDPWDQERRFSERRKFDITVASLPRPRYRRAFEPGCATGLLTRQLAGRCDRVVATDRHPHAVAVATTRAGAHPNVDVRVGRLPHDWPDGRFDLIVFSEVLYYLDADSAQDCLSRAAVESTEQAHMVVVGYRPYVADHALRGDEVDALVEAHAAWRTIVRHVESDFVLTVSERA
jgi:SAM-dependent methyltransferase